MANEKKDVKDEAPKAEIAPAAAGLAPGQARIKYLWDHYSNDWPELAHDGKPMLHKQGAEYVVDAEKATRFVREYGPATRGKIYREPKGDNPQGPLPGEKITDLGCPFEIIESNKALAGAPETK